MFLSFLSDRNFLIFIAFSAFSSLAYAYFAQHFYHVIPCSMCYYERYIYWSVGIISLLGLFTPSFRIFLLRALGLVLAIGVGVGIYHLGIENHWWAAPASCTGVPLAQSPQEFLMNLQSRPMARCDQVGWRIFGISATLLNLVWYVVFFCMWLFQQFFKVKNI